MNKVTYRFILREDIKAKDGKQYIYLYVNMNGKTKTYAVGYSIIPRLFDANKQRVKPGCPDYTIINTKLSSLQNALNDIIIKADLDHLKSTHADLYDLFHAKTISTDLVEWMELDLKHFSGKYAKETVHTYAAQLSKLKGFCKSIKFEDITPAWWLRYEQYMVKRGNSVNTRHKAFTQLKVFINKAIEHDIIIANPLRNVKVKDAPGNRQFMNMDEVELVEKFFNETTNQKNRNVLRCFLFSCFTGLRYTDVKLLTWDNIQNGQLVVKFHKTQKLERLPMSRKAIAMLPEKRSGTNKVFVCFSNQKMNDYLEKCITAAGIKKHITFHCARHTFATISLQLSGDIATVSKLLGHSNIATTQIYARVLDNNKQSVIDLWNKSHELITENTVIS